MFSPTGRGEGSSNLAALVAAGVVVAVAVLTHYEILTYWFTGSDTLTLVEKSRMRTPAEAWTVFSSPLMYGTNFSIIVALFYRPVANLSYAIDFALWGLDPFGYHLTDLLLHAIASVLTFAFVRRVSKDTLVGALAGCLFALHPITAEVVPTPARRHDVLTTIFVLVSLLLFFRVAAENRSRRRRWLFLAGSVFAYLLAVGAKEIGVLAPPLVGAWFLLLAYDRRYSVPEALWRGLKVATPYTLVTLAYLWWRYQVLGGLGGYRGGPWKTSEPLLEVLSKYLLSLLYPVDLAGWLLSYQLPLVPNVLYVLVPVALGLFAYAVVRIEAYRDLLASDRGRLVAISLAWLAVLGAIFVGFGRYSLRSGYVALVPTGALLSLLLVRTGRELYSSDRLSKGALGTVGIFLLTGALVCSLVFVSPLVYPYDDWERAGDVASEALPAAADTYEREDLPPRSVIAIAGIPRRPGSPGVVAKRPQARTIAFFYANTVASWIRLTHPDSRVATYVGGPTVPIGEQAVNVNATIEQTTDRRHYQLRFRYPPENATRPPNGAGAANGS
ncbi:hypothetical protein BRC86_02965 [Halobacteriales archaeon QS_3_64_16]|nr:MAG: hypothetical protein BRC86_02965 [Halobacteriales archaeon QS_3_64_16]